MLKKQSHIILLAKAHSHSHRNATVDRYVAEVLPVLYCVHSTVGGVIFTRYVAEVFPVLYSVYTVQ